MTVTLQEYSRTNDPATLEAIEARITAYQPWLDKSKEFARRVTGLEDPPVYGGWTGGGWDVQAIGGPIAAGNGQWKPEGYGFAPYKNNPLRAEFDDLFAPVPPPPGLAPVLLCESDGTPTWMVRPSPFIVDGYAYLQLPGPAKVDDAASVWEEIRASQWHQAHEAFTDEAGQG